MEREPQNGQTIILYHSSPSPLVKHPLVRAGRYITDFGQGFYTTTNWNQAHEWGVKNAERSQDWAYGFYIYSYNYIHDSRFSVRFFDRPDREWLQLIIKGRSGGKLPYDIVIGPMADDNLRTTILKYEEKLKRCKNDHERKLLEDKTISELNTFDKSYDQMAFLNQRAADRLICASSVQYGPEGEYIRTNYPYDEVLSKTDLHRPAGRIKK